MLSLKVKEIVPIDGIYSDATLMPFIPGLSDAGSCSEWETGIPVNLNKIRDKDEKYWDDYRGTPKAFINTSLGLELWKNRFGNYTAFRFDSADYSKEDLQKKLTNTINPEDLNLQLLNVKEEGMYAAQHGVDFGQLFISLSFFVLLSGIILTVLLFVFHASQRRDQIGTFSAMGFSRVKITSLFTLESLASTLLGVVPGIFLALAYTHLVFLGLSRVWGDIVRTTILEIHIVPATLVIGAIASVLVAILSLYFVIRRITRNEVVGLQKKTTHDTSRNKIKRIRVSFVVTLLLGTGFIVMQLLSAEILNPAIFFIAGIILMLSFFLFFMLYLDKLESKAGQKITLQNLGTKNLLRNKGRSLSVFILLCIGSFLVISTGINRKDFSKTAKDKSSGTGGFLFMAESTVPVLKNLNDPEVAQEFGFSENYQFVQFRAHEGDDASCLNLNRIRNPRILGVDPQKLTGRFTFQTKTEFLDSERPWKSLHSKVGDAVPAVADQTVIQWGLGKKVGDTLVYKNALGEDLELLLIGGLAGSVFQGNVIVSNTFFLENFPTSSGSKVFLIDGDASKDSTMTAELNNLFRDYGWTMERSIDKLMEFKTVENTYLTIFLVMGALGLLLGTIGAAVVLARNIQDRKQEIALLLATGYKKGYIIRMLFRENSILLFAGLAGGLVAAIIATLPSVIANFEALPLTFLLLSLMVIIINGLAWIFIISYVQMANIQEIRVLRNE
jgi:ABC-type antimicrobial peptide transport system permease subunit